MVGDALKPKTGRIGRFDPESIGKDVIAGLVLSILLVPQAMAYAQLAGLPPETGLYASLLPPLLYLLFGTSAFVSTGPVALVSLVIAEAATSAGGEPLTAAMIIGLQAGAMLVVLGALGLGRLVNFISEPVLLGFTAAAAVLIATSQLPTLLGIEAGRAGNLPDALAGLWQGLPGFDATTALIGVAALIVLLLAHRYAEPLLWKAGLHPPYRQGIAKSLPLAIIVGAACVAAMVPHDVPTVEAIDSAMPRLSFPDGGMALWIQLLPSSFAVAIIIFVTATAVAKSLAGRDRSNLDTSREAVALGAGNIAAALTGGYAIGASLSRSALVEDSGGRTPLASVVASVCVLAVLFLLAPLLAYLPRTALAALVISAVFGLVKMRDMRQVWGHDRTEGAIIALSFLATLLLGVRFGLGIGAALGLIHYLWFSSVPRVTRVGTDDGGETYRSYDRDDVEIQTLPVLVVRIDRSIYFGNSAYCEDQIVSRLGWYDGVECLVLDMRAVNAVDASGAAMLLRLVERLSEDDITVRFAETHEPVAERLKPYGGERSEFHRTVADALERCGVPQNEPIAPT
ncbi:SulP family inorganic anion transporter [Qipengyuania sp. JC766]|uniref:SulP family inorganic anion transporter n=1 Tax=Qipengyuania sp. JC766 TaxID=3232139 RepID=UPI00345894D4